jgi:hypothetical protein
LALFIPELSFTKLSKLEASGYFFVPNNIVCSKNISMMSAGRNTLSSYSGKDRLKEDNRHSLNISLLKPKKNYLIEEEC